LGINFNWGQLKGNPGDILNFFLLVSEVIKLQVETNFVQSIKMQSKMKKVQVILITWTLIYCTIFAFFALEGRPRGLFWPIGTFLACGGAVR